MKLSYFKIILFLTVVDFILSCQHTNREIASVTNFSPRQNIFEKMGKQQLFFVIDSAIDFREQKSAGSNCVIKGDYSLDKGVEEVLKAFDKDIDLIPMISWISIVKTENTEGVELVASPKGGRNILKIEYYRREHSEAAGFINCPGVDPNSTQVKITEFVWPTAADIARAVARGKANGFKPATKLLAVRTSFFDDAKKREILWLYISAKPTSLTSEDIPNLLNGLKSYNGELNSSNFRRTKYVFFGSNETNVVRRSVERIASKDDPANVDLVYVSGSPDTWKNANKNIETQL